ncbi:hypothetical protein [Actinacidiphila sp. ITFR-21]|uniref:hypothetical protein n=1 Tax=Actinacidiphila sp. ITFR-21 TaxID=3075199 RepID=UPI002889BBCF|nr:hypothetical protein [Streptomyces sp. ITFR-21]WNI15592.1 hypothetical protein RLT57_08655 [Streptomyces sp. ITFR-21]
MAERTGGGHWLDTGDGLVSVDPLITGDPDPHRDAWVTYLDHVDGCAECKRRLYGCPDGADLWKAYKAGRSQ